MSTLDRPAGVREGEGLDAERLAAYLGEHAGIEGELTVRQFPSGFSRNRARPVAGSSS